MKIKHFDSKQEVSGLERAREWSHEVTRKQQKRNKRKSKDCNSDLVCKYSSLEPSYILTFSTLDDADEHMDTECRVMQPENECVYDTIRRQWAATATSVKGKSRKISESQYHPDRGDRSEAWDRETMFSQLAKRSSQNVDSGVRNSKYFRSTRIDMAINSFGIVFKIYVYFVGEK